MLDAIRRFFDHSRHKLTIPGCDATLDLLVFNGDEGLSQPFSYHIGFTSTVRDITAEAMLGHLTLDHQVVTLQYRLELANGISYQVPVPSDYRNSEQAPPANCGLHKHATQNDRRHHYADVLDSAATPEGENP